MTDETILHDWGEKWPFPDPRKYAQENDEPVWVRGYELDENTIWWAYYCGYFPWFSYKINEVEWCGPVVRNVIFPKDIHISHSMRNMMNRNLYRVTIDTDFDGVIEKCSVGSHYEPNRAEDLYAWLGEEIKTLYKHIHHSGGIGPGHCKIKAHSVEVWERATGELVGGLYGLEVNRVFVGESMFSLRPGTSKLALISLARYLEDKPFDTLIDCQMPTPHLTSMGARPLSFNEYLSYLRN